MNILKIFLTIAVVIRQNISLSLEPFYASNSSQLKEFSNSLVHLSYIFAKRFRSLFSYKWDKLEKTTSSYLNFLEHHLLEEENSLN
jgi:cell shape-determining protein MreC